MFNYNIEKHKQLTEINKKDTYVLWKSKGYSIRGIYQGSKKECEEKLKEIKSESC